MIGTNTPLNNTLTKAIFAVFAVTLLIIAELLLLFFERIHTVTPLPMEKNIGHTVQFLAFGDVNLGRTVGQKILKISASYPFEKYDVKQDSADIVFANLESQVSDQHGETGHPKYNLIFTAPPEAITALKMSGINLFSTANNHAFDYGIAALKETIDRLQQANIRFVGTSKESANTFNPLIIEKNSIKFAIFSVTSFVNITVNGWQRYIATPDTAQLAKKIRMVRDSVDVVVMSYHGGIEYTDEPAKKVRDFADWCVNNGVDIFLGHHPHVPFGIEKKGKSFIVHSLGNFIFYQPQHYWTQRSYGVKFLIEKNDTAATVVLSQLYPVNVSMQTKRLTDSLEYSKLIRRTQQLSNIDLSHYWN